ncbi:SAM-dependent methlyltransferase [Kitasatospora sp. MMS16-BH015]|uniref:class I SAM-dependent methyltransferase n=1 Tax=Kitasatospora sp. MMS16-BH015 TaxID=2018025 RepID=UPI000CA0944A|nr:class I SAM-dependent methyltransferase [Kitasatospora sp. MMS16-BH015]AUG80867.1 SAM-dependent methlyltransferase [Kitasatospora sp. MMS16-BH015]
MTYQNPRPGYRDDPAGVRAFFAARAATWNERFPEDGPRFAAAIAELGLRPGQFVLDAGCGTGRALPLLRAAVGPTGRVLGVDLTPEMLQEAAAQADFAELAAADVLRLPLAEATVDAVFGSGLVSHLTDPVAGFRELARVTRPGGLLALFYPIGRAALAAKHGRTLTPEDVRTEPNLRAALATAGWELTGYDDQADRFLAVARRMSSRRVSSHPPAL